ncbi:hypothetical protein LSTR_LSTR016517 [Laodelphax striatellus]|uniref:Uncharacterized protein n=1 Tax=Laodelphax striatellus TaxID=195883 RepID=A0A482XL92_LAOST|nr:hypothetical protein LSTR_LSTR016517 [Laodelphax striatellus]
MSDSDLDAETQDVVAVDEHLSKSPSSDCEEIIPSTQQQIPPSSPQPSTSKCSTKKKSSMKRKSSTMKGGKKKSSMKRKSSTMKTETPEVCAGPSKKPKSTQKKITFGPSVSNTTTMKPIAEKLMHSWKTLFQLVSVTLHPLLVVDIVDPLIVWVNDRKPTTSLELITDHRLIRTMLSRDNTTSNTTTPHDDHIRAADRKAIGAFLKDSVFPLNTHSIIGAAGLSAKYIFETVAGVQYPKNVSDRVNPMADNKRGADNMDEPAAKRPATDGSAAAALLTSNNEDQHSSGGSGASGLGMAGDLGRVMAPTIGERQRLHINNRLYLMNVVLLIDNILVFSKQHRPDCERDRTINARPNSPSVLTTVNIEMHGKKNRSMKLNLLL